MTFRASVISAAMFPTVLILSSCTTDPEPPAETAASTTATVAEDADAFRFTDATLKLGSYEENAELFNACESLSGEELKEAGLNVAGEVDQTPTSVSCPMTKDGNSAVAYVVSSVAASRDNIGEFDQSLKVKDPEASSSVPDLYLGEYAGEPPMCGAFVDTTSGILSVNVLDVHGEMPVDEACTQAQETLEKLYALGN